MCSGEGGGSSCQGPARGGARDPVRLLDSGLIQTCTRAGRHRPASDLKGVGEGGVGEPIGRFV